MKEGFVGYIALIVGCIAVFGVHLFVFTERLQQYTEEDKPITSRDLMVMLASFAGIFIMALILYEVVPNIITK